MTDFGGYLVGRKLGEWPAAITPAADMLFAAVRKDGETLDGVEFQHCTFANVSFKEVRLEQCRFTDCIFLNCYFRKSAMVGSSFIACKFVDCDFPKVAVESCDFKHSHFECCSIPFAEMEHSLPREPNLREELAHELAIASDVRGHGADGRRYRLAAIQAREEHLWAAVLGNSEWYQRHYSGLRKLKALGQLFASRVNGLIWGHGEKWHILVRNIVILVLVIFPATLWLVRDDLHHQGGDLTFGDLMWLSATTVVPIGGVISVAATTWVSRAILTSEGFIGVVAAGLLVTLLVRRMLMR